VELGDHGVDVVAVEGFAEPAHDLDVRGRHRLALPGGAWARRALAPPTPAAENACDRNDGHPGGKRSKPSPATARLHEVLVVDLLESLLEMFELAIDRSQQCA
jgi:hypothetical protein